MRSEREEREGCATCAVVFFVTGIVRVRPESRVTSFVIVLLPPLPRPVLLLPRPRIVLALAPAPAPVLLKHFVSDSASDST